MKKKPFFAKFLENQHAEMEEVKGGRPDQTMKYPSDNDEDIYVTLKYPSDNDEHVTLKYPSDNDEDIYVTMKAPSDQDELIDL